MSDSSLTTRESGNKIIVDIDAQNVDFRNCEVIKSTLATIISNDKKDVLLNLSQVNFMDSSGLSVLLFGKRISDDAGVSFSVFGLQSYVNNLVTLTNLHKSMSIYKDEQEALV